MDDLAGRVNLAVETLANGMLTPRLAARCRRDERLTQQVYDRALRIVYGLLTLLSADARGLLRGRSRELASARRDLDRLRKACKQPSADQRKRPDIWEQLARTFRSARRALPWLGFLDQTPEGCQLPEARALNASNEMMAYAVRQLTSAEAESVGHGFDYRRVSAWQLGGVHEVIVAFAPRIDSSTRAKRPGAGRKAMFRLAPRLSDRKAAGSYYTHPSLVAELVRSALAPVVRDRLRRAGLDAELRDSPGEAPTSPLLDYGRLSASERRAGARAILGIRVCDPACGPGPFLLAAHDYLATELARIRTRRPDPPDQDVGRARQEVTGRCIYGVDVDPIAVELARASLWLDSGGTGTTSERLARHIKCGNALIGMAPQSDVEPRAGFAGDRFGADAWCAAALRERGESRRTAEALRRFRFFHWPLEFPDVLGEAGRGGFDCVLCNPPWEHIELKEREFFAARAPSIAKASTGAERKRCIARLKQRDPNLHAAYLRAKQSLDEQVRFIRESGRFPLTARGRINNYAVFAEACRTLINPRGRVGLLVPSGIGTDSHTRFFFRDLMDRGSLASLYDFENAAGLFPNVHRSYKFCCLTLVGSEAPSEAADFVFFAHNVKNLAQPSRHVALSARDIRDLNPNTRTCPVFRSKRDAVITRRVYRRLPVLVREAEPQASPWGVKLRQGIFNVTAHSDQFRSRQQLEDRGGVLKGSTFILRGERFLPLYEQNLVHQFDHRFATFDRHDDSLLRSAAVDEKDHADPRFTVLPRFWVAEREVDRAAGDHGSRGRWLLCHRLNGRPTDQRTMIAAIVPWSAVGNSLVVVTPGCDAVLTACLCANLNSFAFDFIARQKVGGLNLNAFLTKQLPVVPPSRLAGPCRFDTCTWSSWIARRVVELSYTSHDLRGFAEDCGLDRPPSRWDPERRFGIRCELDAAFFHLYGLARRDVSYIMETFPIVRRNDLAAYGEYRTKRTIAEIYDAIHLRSCPVGREC